MERAIVEAYALENQDRKARSLVETWHSATRALRTTVRDAWGNIWQIAHVV